jgi:hypothetical protein
MAQEKSPAQAQAGAQGEAAEAPARPVQQDVIATQVKDALAVLFAFRLVNVLCVRTFFQPDEYFQALEPAWQLVFGPESGAWMTWVRVEREHALCNIEVKHPLTCTPGMAIQTSLVSSPRRICGRLRYCGKLRKLLVSACSLPSLCSAGCPESHPGWACCLE